MVEIKTTTPPDVDGLVERLRDRAESYRIGEPSSEHTADLLDEAVAALSSERSAHEQTKVRLAEVEKALEPFANVAEHDIGDDEDDSDTFLPMSNARYSMAGRLRVGHLRASRRALGGKKHD